MTKNPHLMCLRIKLFGLLHQQHLVIQQNLQMLLWMQHTQILHQILHSSEYTLRQESYLSSSLVETIRVQCIFQDDFLNNLTISASLFNKKLHLFEDIFHIYGLN